MDVGFIGLGLMGRPMAQHLIDAGYTLHLWARNAASLAPFAGASAKLYASPAELARHCAIVFTMVTDVADVAEIIFGTASNPGLIQGSAPQSCIVDCSTIGPQAARNFNTQLALHHIHYFDAPVSGGEIGAIQKKLTIMVGGPQEHFPKIEALLFSLGHAVTYIGSSGAGQVAKVCNQILTGVGVLAVAEMICFAERSGVDTEAVRTALMAGSAGSRILEQHGARMLARDFKPGFKSRMHQKDLRIVLEEAHRLGVALPLSATAAQYFNALVGAGSGEEDSIALLKLLENMSAPLIR